ncbi:MAG: hypothetical protein BM557_10850 [Flavobacterium sp. MedPE-SWcel]|nr:MAG: hypothetical protein BM557_10850 [Flavobacterium sp. MedPE-SWcel]
MIEAEKNNTLTLAEESFLCSVIKILRRNGSMEYAYKLKDLAYCNNYRFRSTYLLYFLDLNGYKETSDAFGKITPQKKDEDISYLNLEYKSWLQTIKGKQNENNLIGYISNETGKQLKELRKFCKRTFTGHRYHNYLEKSIILHGKYIHQIINEYYQEQKFSEQKIIIDKKTIIINAYTYVHILYRHYSKAIKQHQNKSYHFDSSIDYQNLPSQLYKVLQCYKSNITSLNDDYIYFKLNNTNYALWFKKQTRYLKGGVKEDYLRLETFYPISFKSDYDRIASMKLLKTSCGYNFYKK